MGNRNSGRRPQSTALKLLHGNPSKTRLNPHEPQFQILEADADTPPPALAHDPVAAAEWARVIPILRRAKLITDADWPLLLALVQEWSRYVDAKYKTRRSPVIKNQWGKPIASPYVSIGNKALANCTLLWRELGLSPSSRSKLSTLPPDAGPSKWAGYL